MSRRYKGGVISATAPTTSTSTAKGVWTLPQQMQAQAAGNWPSQPPIPSSQSYTTAGTYTWVAPAGVTSVSVVAVGGGGGGGISICCCGLYSGGGGGGGALAYLNNYSVTPGNSYTVIAGIGGLSNCNISGGQSYFNTTGTVGAKGGTTPFLAITGGAGGTVLSGTGFAGGLGGDGGCSQAGPGGGGAGGYAGAGGKGGTISVVSGIAGTGGAGGGGASGNGTGGFVGIGGGGGGGIGLLGQGTSGAGATVSGAGGGGGSCGAVGGSTTTAQGTSGGLYGGGGGGHAYFPVLVSPPRSANGAVRIVWPGNTRTFPSTCVGSP